MFWKWYSSSLLVFASSGTKQIHFDNTTTFAKSSGRRRIWQKKKATSTWPLKPWFCLWPALLIFQVTKAAIRVDQRGKTLNQVFNQWVMSHSVCIIRVLCDILQKTSFLALYFRYSTSTYVADLVVPLTFFRLTQDSSQKRQNDGRHGRGHLTAETLICFKPHQKNRTGMNTPTKVCCSRKLCIANFKIIGFILCLDPSTGSVGRRALPWTAGWLF